MLALRVSMRAGADEAQADDVAQEVLLKMWQIRDRLDGYKSADALAGVMARNLVIDCQRRERGNTLLSEQVTLADTSSDPEQRMIGQEQEHLLQQMFYTLPWRQQAVLKMRQVEHRSYAEIAALLGITEDSAKTLLSRARKTILKMFQTNR